MKKSSSNKQRDGSAAAAAKEVPRRKCGEINTRRNATATTRSPSVAVVAIIPAQEGLLLPSSQRHVSSKNHRIAPASPRMMMIKKNTSPGRQSAESRKDCDKRDYYRRV